MIRKIISLALVILLLAGCSLPPAPTSQPSSTAAPQESTTDTQPPEDTTAEPTTETTAAPTENTTTSTEAPTEGSTSATEETEEATAPTEPKHSQFYIPGLSVEDVILYFNEVVLDAEFSSGEGNPSLVQKWNTSLHYTIYGDYTDKDLQVLKDFADWLNSIEGFPGIYESEGVWNTNVSIYFRDEEGLISLMGDDFIGCDGGVTFWYMDNAIYDATIGYRNDIDQYIRNSVILEEIYNGLGPLQDTSLRPDSICYTHFTTPQELTQIDELILRLLYHPDILCGMNAEECEQVIRQLYY